MKRLLSCVLSFLMVLTVLCADALAIQSITAEPAPQHSTKIKRMADRLGNGPDALVAVRLQDGSVLSGYIAASSPSTLSIADPNTDAVRTVSYAEVSRFAGYNLVTGKEAEEGGGVRAKLARVFARVVPMNRVPANNLSGGSKVLLVGIVIGIIVAIVVARTI